MANYKYRKYLPKKKSNAVGRAMTVSTVVFIAIATALIVLAYQDRIIGRFKTFGMVLLAIGVVVGAYAIHRRIQSKIKEM